MAELWERMSHIYGQRWNSAMGSIGGPAFKTWCLGLESISLERLKLGIKRCLHGDDEWPPNLPAFRKRCLPSLQEMGLPEPREAFRLACNPYARELPAIVSEARSRIGSWELPRMPEKEAWPLFRRIYEELVSQHSETTVKAIGHDGYPETA